MLQRFPTEIVLEVARHLSFRELLAFFSTCSELWAYFDTSLVWLTFIKNLRMEAPLSDVPHTQLESLSTSSLRDIARRTVSVRENWNTHAPRIKSVVINMLGHRKMKLAMIMPGSDIIALHDKKNVCLTFLHVPSGARSNSVVVGASISVWSEAMFEDGHYFVGVCTRQIEDGPICLRLLRINPNLGINSVQAIFSKVLPMELQVNEIWQDLYYRGGKITCVTSVLGERQINFTTYDIKTGLCSKNCLITEVDAAHTLSLRVDDSTILVGTSGTTHRASYWICDHKLLAKENTLITPEKVVVSELSSDLLFNGGYIDYMMPCVPAYGMQYIEAQLFDSDTEDIPAWTELISQARFTFVPMPKGSHSIYDDSPSYADILKLAISPNFSPEDEESVPDALTIGSDAMVVAIVADEENEPLLITVHPRRSIVGPGKAIIKHPEMPALPLSEVVAIEIDERMGTIHLLHHTGVLHSINYN